MAESTDELEAEVDPDGEFEDGEAHAAIEEAQSVLDDVPGGDGDGSTASSGSGSGASSSDSGGLSLPSPSLPSLPSPSLPSSESLTDLFSPTYFGLALVLSAAAMVLGGLFVPIFDRFGGYLALFTVTFLLGLASGERHYGEVGLAGGLVVGGLALLGWEGMLGRLAQVVAGGASPTVTAAIYGGVGLLMALLATYLGRDLRAGLALDDDGGDSVGGEDGPPEW